MKTYTLTNFATGQTIKKTQKTRPKISGFTVVSAEAAALPETDSTGRKLFRDANNRPYYAAVNADGSHYQP